MDRLFPNVVAALTVLSWGCGEPWRETTANGQDGGAGVLMAHDTFVGRDAGTLLGDLPWPADGDSPDLPSPDLGPPANVPAPPYGDTVGVTARNFRDLPDCDVTSAASACAAQLHDLYDYYGQYDGVVVALLRPG